MIDTHCHLNFQAFANDIDNVVRRFIQQGGEYMNIVGAAEDTSKTACEIAEKYPCCFAAVGIHPHHADTATLPDLPLKLERLAQNKKVIAIGETGLDYYQYKNSPSPTPKNVRLQKKLFTIHLDVAHSLKLPLIIHSRHSHHDLLSILTKYLKNRCLNGVFHCFEGSDTDLQAVLGLGFYVGFDGNITYPKNDKLRQLVKNTPLNRLLVETDSPYLPLQTMRGSRNEPANIKLIIKAISEIKEEEVELIEQETSKNAKLLFNYNYE